MRFARRGRTRGPDQGAAGEEDPLAGVANLFDVSVAFIVALLIALFALSSSGALLDPDSTVVMVTEHADGSLEIMSKEGREITVQRTTEQELSGQGQRLGVAYRLADGQVVYVPETDAASVR